MALQEDKIKGDSTLGALTAEQITRVVELSLADETTVIGSRIGELHGQYDSDVFSASGIAKDQGEKSYDYTKRVITSILAKQGDATTLNSRITALEAEKVVFEKTIADNTGDALLISQLADTRSLLENAKQEIINRDTALTDKDTEHQKVLSSFKLDREFDKAVVGLKLKSEYPDSIKNALIAQAKTNVLGSYTPDWIIDNGVNKLVFRDANKQIKTDDKTNTYDYKGLLALELKEALEVGAHQKGAGTGANGGKRTNSALINVSSAKNQVEADDMITAHLMSQGLTRGSAEMAERKTALWVEHKVSALPAR